MSALVRRPSTVPPGSPRGSASRTTACRLTRESPIRGRDSRGSRVSNRPTSNASHHPRRRSPHRLSASQALVLQASLAARRNRDGEKLLTSDGLNGGYLPGTT